MDSEKILGYGFLSYLVLNVITLIILIFYWNVAGKIFWYTILNLETWFYFLLLIGAIFGLHKLSHKKFSIDECLATMGAAVLPFFMVFTIFMGTSTGLSDYCIMNSLVESVVYIESYYTESTEEVCEGSGENRECHTETKCDVYHAPQRYLRAANKHTINISINEYNNTVRHFGSQTRLVTDAQPGQCSSGGEEYETSWSGAPETRLPCSYLELYINYIKATESLYRSTGQSKMPVLAYPTLQATPFGNIGVMRVLGDNVPKSWAVAVDSYLDHQLTVFGEKRQANILVYLTKNPPDFFGSIKEKWVGGKKNDIIVVIGGKLEKPDWVRILCWAKDATFEIKLQDKILNSNNSDPQQFITDLITHIDHPDYGFQRKPMENYRYLLSEVHLSWWAILLVIILTAVTLSPLVFGFFLNNVMY